MIEFLKRKFQINNVAKKFAGNTGWLLIDKILLMIVGLVVTLLVARYYGPTGFGVFSYAQSYTIIFSAFAAAGLQGIVIRDLIHKPESSRTTIASALAIRISGGVCAVILASASIYIVRPDDITTFHLVLVLSLMLIPQATEVIHYRYFADLNSKPVVTLKIINAILFSFIKVYLIITELPLFYLACSFLVEHISASAAIILLSRHHKKAFGWCDISSTEIIRLLKEVWPLIISGISVLIYMRIDQIMLGEMLNSREVGIYSAASKISEIWYFIPTTIILSVTPILSSSYKECSIKYENQTLRVLRTMVWLSVSVAIFTSFFSFNLINIIYGPEYTASVNVLTVQVWAGIFVCLGVATGPWFVNAGLLRYSMYQTFAGAAINVAGNFLLIPHYGVVGAAIATVASYAVSAVLVNAIFKKTRKIFFMQIKAFFK